MQLPLTVCIYGKRKFALQLVLGKTSGGCPRFCKKICSAACPLQWFHCTFGKWRIAHRPHTENKSILQKHTGQDKKFSWVNSSSIDLNPNPAWTQPERQCQLPVYYYHPKCCFQKDFLTWYVSFRIGNAFLFSKTFSRKRLSTTIFSTINSLKLEFF